MSTVKANTLEPASGGTITITGAALTTPALGTPASGTLTNCTGLPASGVVNTPAGGISATTVQAALNELDTEKFDKAGGATSGPVQVNRSTNPKGAGLAVGGDMAVHAGNIRTTCKYVGDSGIGASNTWETVVDLSTLQTATGHFGGRVKCLGAENGTVNGSYCEYYLLYSSVDGWLISAIGTKLVTSNGAWADMSLRISGTNLQVQNGAGATGVGGYFIALDIFEPL